MNNSDFAYKKSIGAVELSMVCCQDKLHELVLVYGKLREYLFRL